MSVVKIIRGIGNFYEYSTDGNQMSTTFNQVFDAVKAHSTEILEEYGEKLPDEGAYNTIIENALIKLFFDIQEDVGCYNATMSESEFDSEIELIEIEGLE